MKKSLPIISVCVVAYNEEEFVEDLLDDILVQTYPRRLTELIFVDSLSTDGTMEIFRKFRDRYSESFYDVKVLENPGKRLAAGWNEVIGVFSGEILVRVDAHARLSGSFVEETVRCQQSGEYVCGGRRPNIIVGNDPMSATLLMAEQSMFGSSFATYRSGEKRCYVKSVFHAAYRREVIEKVGPFNAALGRTEDNEYNYRVQKAGYKICFEPRILSYQHTRPRLLKMIKQKYGNGYWIARTLFVCPGCISFFHLVPFAFVCAAVLTAVMAGFGWWWFAAAMWALYFAFAIANTVISVKKKGDFQKKFLLLPLLFLLLHLSYGAGSVVGFFSLIFKPIGRCRNEK